jgi:hypothetical protein
MLDEQAVSDVKLGPRKSKKWEMRFDCMAYAQPVQSLLGSQLSCVYSKGVRYSPVA